MNAVNSDKTYRYYPGCSLKATGVAYETSLLAVCRKLGFDCPELDDWNCCGATAYFSVREILSHAIAARNLAIAESEAGDDAVIVAPCSACYLGLAKANKYMREFPDLKRRVDDALDAAGLAYSGNVTVKHLLQVFVEDLGQDAIGEQVSKPLEGLKVAGYVGCQMVRPDTGFDSMEYPRSLDDMSRWLGATPVDFPMAARCCGGSQIMTNDEVALGMCKNILLAAERKQADVIVTACPLCQMNLDAFQGRVNSMFGTNFNIPVLFFTQLMGVAYGETDLGLEKNIVSPRKALASFM